MKIFICIACLAIIGCSNKKRQLSKLPPCLQTLVKKWINEKQTPNAIIKYEYKGDTVYYVAPPCCDQYNSVYTKDCRVLGAPDGGIDGIGDGKIPDFDKVRKGGEVLWDNMKE